MLLLKKINYKDIDKEYEAITKIPYDENGFENKYYNISKEEFKNEVIPQLLKNSEGIDLPEGYVPDTYFFLWKEQEIVGLFKIRHYLNDSLKKRSWTYRIYDFKKLQGQWLCYRRIKTCNRSMQKNNKRR